MYGRATDRNGRLLSPEEVARTCGLSRRAVYRAIARGELRAARLCNRLRVQPAELERWIGEQTVAPEASASAKPRLSVDTAPPGSLRALLDGADEAGGDRP
jgi:excisionase family DNA binding protein